MRHCKAKAQASEAPELSKTFEDDKTAFRCEVNVGLIGRGVAKTLVYDRQGFVVFADGFQWPEAAIWVVGMHVDVCVGCICLYGPAKGRKAGGVFVVGGLCDADLRGGREARECRDKCGDTRGGGDIGRVWDGPKARAADLRAA